VQLDRSRPFRSGITHIRKEADQDPTKTSASHRRPPAPEHQRPLLRSRNGSKDVVRRIQTAWTMWDVMDDRPRPYGKFRDPMGYLGQVPFAS
jgi:hypothetical protein